MSAPRSPSTAPLSEATQAGITVALGAYLVGLLLTVLGNSSNGSSVLVRTIKGRLVTPWLAPAWLDLGFERHLAHGLPEDADHEIEIRATGGTRAGGQVVRLPGGAGGERAARWRRLARAMATGDAGDPAILAAAVSRGAFAAVGAEDVGLRILRRDLPERDAWGGDAPLQAAYAARVRRVHGELQLIPAEPKGEVAPLARPRVPAP